MTPKLTVTTTDRQQVLVTRDNWATRTLDALRSPDSNVVFGVQVLAFFALCACCWLASEHIVERIADPAAGLYVRAGTLTLLTQALIATVIGLPWGLLRLVQHRHTYRWEPSANYVNAVHAACTPQLEWTADQHAHLDQALDRLGHAILAFDAQNGSRTAERELTDAIGQATRLRSEQDDIAHRRIQDEKKQQAAKSAHTRTTKADEFLRET